MTDVDAVRVDRFQWERLMMMSDLPAPDRFRLLALGIFMDADGRNARPGNANLALLGYHEETWKQLMRRTVRAGWLILLSRGGARRGPGGTTIRRASVYAASVPREVWERREAILAARPWRSSGVEGSAESAPDPLKEASGAPFDRPETLKEASGASFKAPEPFLKEAPRDFLPASLKEASDGFEGSISGFEGSPQRLPHHAVTTTHLHHPPAAAVEGSSGAQQGGGGGGGGDVSPALRARATAFIDALDYRGQRLSRSQYDALCARAAAALAAGWTEQTLKEHLDLGHGEIKSAIALYRYRLDPEELPDPPAAEKKTAAAPTCGECDTDGFRYRDPVAETGAYRCPCRSTRTQAA